MKKRVLSFVLLLTMALSLVALPACGGNNDGGGAPPATTNTDGVDIDAMVRARLAVARVGDKLGIVGIDGMPIRDAKCAVINHVNPKLNLDGRSDAYIDAAYDLAAEQANGGSSVASQLKGMSQKNADGKSDDAPTNAAAARERMMNRRKEGNK